MNDLCTQKPFEVKDEIKPKSQTGKQNNFALLQKTENFMYLFFKTLSLTLSSFHEGVII
jgi:hypothetical protein